MKKHKLKLKVPEPRVPKDGPHPVEELIDAGTEKRSGTFDNIGKNRRWSFGGVEAGLGLSLIGEW